MAGNPAEPPEKGRHPADGAATVAAAHAPAPHPPARAAQPTAAGTAEPSAAAQHVGPLLLERHVKADGRALLLYARASDSA